MLRINTLKNVKNTLAYYDTALVKEGSYYLDNQHVGHWNGKLIDILEISGVVTREHFQKLTNNLHPHTGHKLKPRTLINGRVGYDCTFSTPKSASLIYAITQDEDILKAHHASVEFAMRAIEEAIQVQTGQGKDKRYETVGNGIYSRFTHTTARPTKQEINGTVYNIPEPHLHDHAVVQNLCFNPKENRFQAIEFSVIRREAPYYEALYLSKLAEELQRAQYSIVRKGRFFEIEGISKDVVAKFSSRTKEIEAIAKDKNVISKKVKAKLGAWSRNSKTSQTKDVDLQKLWQEKLTQKELENIRLAKGVKAKSEGKTKDINQSIDLALEHFLERKSVIPKRLVLARAINQEIGKQSAEEIIRAFNGRKDIVSAEQSNTTVITTKEMIEMEEENLSIAMNGRNTQKPLNARYEITNSILNDNQRNSVKHILSSRDKVMILLGDAGTGKTTLMKTVKDGIQANGKTLFAIAPSADASRGALQSKGFKDATTIASFLQSEKIQNIAKDNVLLVDEAALAGTRDINSILKCAQDKNMRVILAGDYKQIPSVNAGSTTRALEKAGLPVTRVKEIVRQRDNPDLKKAIKALADNDQKKAFTILEENKRIIEIKDQGRRDKKIAQAYTKSVENKKSVMLVSATHKEGERVSSIIRETLKKKNLLKHEEKTFNTLKPVSLTESEKQDPTSFKKGMVVQFHKRTSKYRHGYSYEVQGHDTNGDVLILRGKNEGVSPLDLNCHRSFQAYEKKALQIAQGDKIRITKNGKSTENQRLNNGQVLKVEHVDNMGHIKLSNGKTLPKDYGHFTHGYYRTLHASQGRDAKVLLLSQGSEGMSALNKNSFYVGISRGVEDVKVFTDNKSDLKRGASKENERVDAISISRMSERQRLKHRAHEEMSNRVNEIDKKKAYEHSTTRIKKQVSRPELSAER